MFACVCESRRACHLLVLEAGNLFNVSTRPVVEHRCVRHTHKDPSQDLEADAAKIYKRMDKHLRKIHPGSFKMGIGQKSTDESEQKAKR